jgi:hypothetical protein
VQPSSFNQTHNLLGIGGNDRSAAVTKKNVVVEEEDFGVGTPFIKGSESVFEELARGAIFDQGIERVRVFEA